MDFSSEAEKYMVFWAFLICVALEKATSGFFLSHLRSYRDALMPIYIQYWVTEIYIYMYIFKYGRGEES